MATLFFCELPSSLKRSFAYPNSFAVLLALCLIAAEILLFIRLCDWNWTIWGGLESQLWDELPIDLIESFPLWECLESFRNLFLTREQTRWWFSKHQEAVLCSCAFKQSFLVSSLENILFIFNYYMRFINNKKSITEATRSVLWSLTRSPSLKNHKRKEILPFVPLVQLERLENFIIATSLKTSPIVSS